MLRKGNNIKINKQSSSLLKVGMNSCLFVLLGFLFIWGQPFVLDGNHKKESVTQKSFTCNLSDDSFNNSHYPFHLPFESVPTLNEPEALDENEVKDNTDDGCDQLIRKNSSECIFNIASSVKSCFSQITQSLKSRSTVPLFILYHSWKSFLI
jgi:hypothetical protein